MRALITAIQESQIIFIATSHTWLPRWCGGKELACQCRRQETQVQSLGQEDPLEDGMATHSSILAWRIPTDRGTWRATVHGVTELGTTEVTYTHAASLTCVFLLRSLYLSV